MHEAVRVSRVAGSQCASCGAIHCVHWHPTICGLRGLTQNNLQAQWVTPLIRSFPFVPATLSRGETSEIACAGAGIHAPIFNNVIPLSNAKNQNASIFISSPFIFFHNICFPYFRIKMPKLRSHQLGEPSAN